MTALESLPLFCAADICQPRPTRDRTEMVAAPAPDSESVGFADWTPFGVVIPVLAGSSGAGASTFTAIALDVLQQAGRCALAIDPAEPTRSGLAAAAPVAGTDVTHPVEGWGVRYSWRGYSLLAQLEPITPPLVPTLTPLLGAPPSIAPHQWLPPSGLQPLHVTLVDLGQRWSACAHTPLQGAAAWLRMGAPDGPRPWPVLVVRATRPSLMAAEGALARLEPWISAGLAVAPVRLVVMASRKRRGWPAGVTAAAGARVAALLDDAVFVPADHTVDIGGITEQPTPARPQAAVGELLHEWGLLTARTP
jgi:hypothetical protein